MLPDWYQDMFLAMADDYRVILVKLAVNASANTCLEVDGFI